MKLVFFDLEFSNCFSGIGKVCEFGYVMTDENFNVLEEDVFVINPGNDRENRFFIDKNNKIDYSFWYYPIEYYYKQPEFPYFYERIKNILEGEDVIAFAYSSLNDVFHLESTIKRYDLKSLDYVCFDVQKFTRVLNFENKNPGLGTVANRILKKETIESKRLHLSKDDAYITMLVFKKLFELSNSKLKDFLDLHKNYGIRTSKYFLEKEKILKERIEREEVAKYYKEVIKNEQENLKNLKNPAKPAYFTRELRFSRASINELVNFARSKNLYLVDNPTDAEVIVYKDKNRLERLLKNIEEKDYIIFEFDESKGMKL